MRYLDPKCQLWSTSADLCFNADVRSSQVIDDELNRYTLFLHALAAFLRVVMDSLVGNWLFSDQISKPLRNL